MFPNDRRPVEGRRGVHHVTHRHGASEIRSGERIALGIIFHDAVRVRLAGKLLDSPPSSPPPLRSGARPPG